MLVRLNKKFLLTILVLFISSAGLFTIIFNSTVSKKIRSEQNNLLTRSQYVIELLHENISLRKQLNKLQPSENNNRQPQNLIQKQEELTREQKLNEELNKNYNENYEALKEILHILGFSAALAFIALFFLWFLLKYWVIMPVDTLTNLSLEVAGGNFSKRLPARHTFMPDEFDILIQTINFMLDNIEENLTKIKEKETFLQTIINTVPDAIRVIDENYNIVLSNKAYDELVNKNYFSPSAKCYGSYRCTATTPCESSQFICPFKELKKHKSQNMKAIHNVNNRPLSVNAAEISLNGQTGVIESIRDLSDNITYSHQQKISSLAFLSTSLAHEMKNNLGAINLIINGMIEKYKEDDALTVEGTKYLKLISEQIAECINVPERLLKLSRDSEFSNTSFNIKNAISDILSLLDYEIKSKGILLIQDTPSETININGNETDFKMIILNLVQNAINAMPHGGTLQIKITHTDNLLKIAITDSGFGISKHDLPHIFEPYYSTAQNSKKQGTGLGLAIVKNLCLKFNADISVTSTPNVGTCFEIEISQPK